MKERQRERYIRWQDYRIKQVTFSINLFLGFAVASLVYVIKVKLDNKLPGVQDLDLIIKFWAASATFGCVATLSRVLDFRYTAEKIRNKTACNSFIAKYSGRITWISLWGQILTYLTGASFFVLEILKM